MAALVTENCSSQVFYTKKCLWHILQVSLISYCIFLLHSSIQWTSNEFGPSFWICNTRIIAFYFLIFCHRKCFILMWSNLTLFPLQQMDNVISQAQATLGALVLQRSTFGGISTKISNVSSRLPTVREQCNLIGIELPL